MGVQTKCRYRARSAGAGITPGETCGGRRSAIAILRVRSWRRRAAAWYRLLMRI